MLLLAVVAHLIPVSEDPRPGGFPGPDPLPQWGFDIVGGWEALKYPVRRETVVAVIDSGVDYNHPDLRNQLWRNEAEIPDNGVDDDNNGVVDDIVGASYSSAGDGIGAPNGNPMDWDGHGTLVTGPIAAEADNSIGIRGLEPTARIMVIKAWPMDRRALDYAIDKGAHVISASWGTYYDFDDDGNAPLPPSSYRDLIAKAGKRGILFVNNVGNDGGTDERYPAGWSLPNLISVGASDQSDNLAAFSNRGDWVDLAAPGVGIPTTVWKGDFLPATGTSMSAPHVAGAAAALRSRLPEEPTPRQLRTLILETVHRTPGLQGVTASGGRLDLRAALRRGHGLPPEGPPTDAPPEGIDPPQSQPPAPAPPTTDATGSRPQPPITEPRPARGTLRVTSRRARVLVSTRCPQRRPGSRRGCSERARQGQVRVAVQCQRAGARCAGTLRLTARIGRRVHTLGRRTVALPKGRRSTLTLRLSARAQRALRSRRSLTVQATFTGADRRSQPAGRVLLIASSRRAARR
jgi:hypothetical protein